MLTELPDVPTPVETEHYVPPQTPRVCREPQQLSLQDHALNWLAAGCQMILGPRERTGLGILTYHRIADPPDNRPRPTWNVTPERFEQQLKGLLRWGWQAWPLRQALHYAERELPIPRKTFVVTFDVGYANVLIEACPVLTKLRVPATLFLSTAYLDSPEPFPGDDWSAAGVPGTPTDAWRFLTTDECRRLSGNGLIEIGSHTRYHRDFRGRPAELLSDLKDNVIVLKDTFGIDHPAFSPSPVAPDERPSNAELVQAARQAGAICCLNSEPRIVALAETPFNWGRFTVNEADTAATLAGKLGGWHTAVQGLGQQSARAPAQGAIGGHIVVISLREMTPHAEREVNYNRSSAGNGNSGFGVCCSRISFSIWATMSGCCGRDVLRLVRVVLQVVQLDVHVRLRGALWPAFAFLPPPAACRFCRMPFQSPMRTDLLAAVGRETRDRGTAAAAATGPAASGRS